jgi:hypothetical protein
MNIVEDCPEVTTIKGFCKRTDLMTEAAFRWKIFRDEEFRKKCTRKLGRRVYVLPREVVEYIKNQEA